MKNLNNQIKPANFALIAAFAFFTIMACSPAKKDSQQTPAVPDQQQSQENNTENTESAIDVTEDAEVTDTTDGDTETTEQQATEENNSQVTINPPHGEPGHRCDIPVGQPLNAAPAQNTESTSTNNPTAPTLENARRLNGSQPSQTTSTSSANGERINPPHGQPGHRCDVPVGSPLP